MPRSDIALEAVGLSKTYGRVRGRVDALRELDLVVEAGDVFGLLGPNGAGKTTFIKLVLGIARPTGGSLRLFGRTTGTPGARRRVGYLPEQHRFPGHLTGQQVLDLYGRLGGLDRSTRRRQTGELLERVGLASWGDVRVRKYSKGMMQRLGIAQALLGEPQLVLLDEPTDGVDPMGRRDIRELVVWLRDRGVTVFINSHLLAEVEQVCSRVAILDHGRLVRSGRLEELVVARPGFRIRTSPLEGPLPEGLPLTVEQPGRAFRAEVPDAEALAPVLSALLAAGARIEAVEPVQVTLEQAFLALVEPSSASGAAS